MNSQTKKSGRDLEDLENDIQLVNKLKQDLRLLKKQKFLVGSEDETSQGFCKKDPPTNSINASETNFLTSLNAIVSPKTPASLGALETNSRDQNPMDNQQKESATEKEEVSQNAEILRKESTYLEDSNMAEADHEWNSGSKYHKSMDAKTFRQYDLACDRVKEFYEQQHRLQTVAYNIQARINFKAKVRAKMTVWEGLEKLNKLLDDSDPDTELSQIYHALQTAEAIRRDEKPRWMQLVGLIHDLGKLLYFFDSRGQWDVVGDTFPVGCSFLTKIIFSESFRQNPDFLEPSYNTKFGIYKENCGLDNVMLSWGHDEYMYHIAKLHSTLPPEGLAMIRYHSFYPWHQENAYQYLMNDNDKEMLKAVRAFNKYDLYSKVDEQYNVELLKPYYLDLIDEYFPKKLITF